MIARRTFLQTTAFAAIATAIGSRGASAADPLGIALILPSPLGDVAGRIRWPPVWSRSRQPTATP